MAIIPIILTIDYSKNFTTMALLTIEHTAMFVVKSIHIQNNGQVMDLSILCDCKVANNNAYDICHTVYMYFHNLENVFSKNLFVYF